MKKLIVIFFSLAISNVISMNYSIVFSADSNDIENKIKVITPLKTNNFEVELSEVKDFQKEEFHRYIGDFKFCNLVEGVSFTIDNIFLNNGKVLNKTDKNSLSIIEIEFEDAFFKYINIESRNKLINDKWNSVDIKGIMSHIDFKIIFNNSDYTEIATLYWGLIANSTIFYTTKSEFFYFAGIHKDYKLQVSPGIYRQEIEFSLLTKN